uniref:J domain-containing protein n=1 Tax=Panagrolaimus sp. PS1159 TaxID=55785 RepID=A0AC35F9C8_9BILA
MADNNFQSVIDLACNIFGATDSEALTILMYTLASEEKRFGGRALNWQILANLVNQKQSFKSHANYLIKETRRNESKKILDAAILIQEKINEKCTTEFGAIDFFDRNPNLISTNLFCLQSKLWNDLPQIGKAAILKFISKCVKNLSILHAIGRNENLNLIILQTSIYAKSVSITLATLPIPYEILRVVFLWWYEKLHGKLAAKGVVNCTVAVIPRFGKVFCDVGKVVCELGNYNPIRRSTIFYNNDFDGETVATNKPITEILFQQIFSLPKSEAQSLAYKHLNIRSCASDSDVGEAYQRHLIIEHPEKGGSKETFCKLQAFIAIICIARGEIIAK